MSSGSVLLDIPRDCPFSVLLEKDVPQTGMKQSISYWDCCWIASLSRYKYMLVFPGPELDYVSMVSPPLLLPNLAFCHYIIYSILDFHHFPFFVLLDVRFE